MNGHAACKSTTPVPYVQESLDRFIEAYSALSKVWTTAHTQVQKGKGGIHFICYKITVIH